MCLIFHEWTPWNEPFEEGIINFDGVVLRRRAQQRECEDCGKVQEVEISREPIETPRDIKKERILRRMK